MTVTVTAVPHDVNQAWKEYKGKFNIGRINLEGKDSTLRKGIFNRVHKMIVEHNSSVNRTFTMEHNMFSVMTEEERKRYLGYVPPSVRDPQILDDLMEEVEFSNQSISAPANLDYRRNTCLGPVKDQGKCGSCYAFAAVASLEFSNCLLNGNRYVSLSEQQIVDCDKYDGACNGGGPYNVWRYIKENNGIDTTSFYPYVAKSNPTRGTCKFSAGAVGGKVVSYGQLPARDPVGMMNALVKYGVLMVGISVVDEFVFYKGGVYTHYSCDLRARNHAVNVVGYGNDPFTKLDYWVVRNSWSSGWGQGGYIYIQRGVNKCNMESDVGYVVAAKK